LFPAPHTSQPVAYSLVGGCDHCGQGAGSGLACTALSVHLKGGVWNGGWQGLGDNSLPLVTSESTVNILMKY